MKTKQKGTNAERELVHLFWKNGWCGIRVAGSGSIGYPAPDVLAGNGARRLAIESKATADTNKYFPKKEIHELKEFADKFGAEPWVAIRFDNDSWYFLNLEDLKLCNNGYSVSFALAKQKGLMFEEMIGIFRQEKLA
ncbi:MAG: Holliday junction resolvase Hjc [Candidatus Woesearchaeota archaeon]